MKEEAYRYVHSRIRVTANVPRVEEPVGSIRRSYFDHLVNSLVCFQNFSGLN